MLDKSLKIIRTFVDERSSWGVRELATYLNYNVSTTHRILLQLKDQGILEFNHENHKYFIGTELIRISSKVTNNASLQHVSKPFLEELAAKYGETTCLLMLVKEKKKIFWASKINGIKPLQYIIPIGELQPIPYGGSGKTILAYLEEDLIEEILNEENFSQDQKSKIKEELAFIRENKVISTIGERLEGSRGIGAPILNAEHKPIGSIIITAPISRLTESLTEKASVDVKKAAEKISAIFGAVYD